MAAYGDDAGFSAWMASQGLELPDDAPSIAVLRNIGSSYIDAAYGYKLTCSQKTGGWDQELEFPRTGHTINGQTLPDTLIPIAWINASYRAGYLQATSPGWATTGADATRQIKSEKVDVLQTEYFSGADAAGSAVAPGFPSDSIINGMVLPYLCSNVRNLNSLFRVI